MTAKDELARQAWGRIAALFVGADGQRFPRVAADLGLTPGQMRTLLDLRQHEPQPMRAVAEALSCDASYATGLIDGLEAAGLVARRMSPRDRRVKLVQLTDAGSVMQARAVEALQTPPASFDRLTAAQLRTLSDLLADVVHEEPRWGASGPGSVDSVSSSSRRPRPT